MKTKITILLILILLLNCVPKKVPLNEIPMYDGVNITEYQKKINDEFVDAIKKDINDKKSDLKNLNEASDYFLNKGWDFFSKSDYSMAIKRFNQAWLLNNNNSDVYWGFGNYYGVNYKFDDSIKMLKKSLLLS